MSKKILLVEDETIIAMTTAKMLEKTEGITSYGYIVKNSGEMVVLASIKMAFSLFEAKQQIKEREQALKNEKERLQEHIQTIEERERIDEQRNKHLLELYDKIDLSQPDILDYVLNSSLEITNSQFAFSGLINEDETVMTIHRWSTGAMKDCAITDKPIEFPIEEAGIWGDCIRERKPIIINDYQNSTRASKHGTPKGHVHIERFLCVPIFGESKIVAVGAVANKSLPYNDADDDQLKGLNIFNDPNVTDEQKERLRNKENVRYEMFRDSKKKQHNFTLSNTGNPFPAEIGLENSETMGLQLVSSLVDQIDGTIKLQKEPNPVFTIQFPMEE